MCDQDDAHTAVGRDGVLDVHGNISRQLVRISVRRQRGVIAQPQNLALLGEGRRQRSPLLLVGIQAMHDYEERAPGIRRRAECFGDRDRDERVAELMLAADGE